MIIALAGGVGGAKLAQGLALRLAPEDLLIVVNTGDDFEHLGMRISPDLDTVMYWLSDLNDRTRGWGRAGETWNFMAALERLRAPTWFNLGDGDLATHIVRTQRLAQGETLSEVTRFLCAQLGISHHMAPMTDQRVRTLVHTADAVLEFQHYFVREHCEAVITGVVFDGAQGAAPSPAFTAAMSDPGLKAIIICPSNPFLCIDPILAISEVRERIQASSAPVVAISPIIGGKAIKGPAAKIFRELGCKPSAVAVARHYGQLIDGLVIDTVDAKARPAIEAMGVRVAVTDIVMKDRADQARLAAEVLAFARQMSEPPHA
jgi:LPPG:FO 2-phospho-L-lactate transferase